jgi:hypothetical protein
MMRPAASAPDHLLPTAAGNLLDRAVQDQPDAVPRQRSLEPLGGVAVLARKDLRPGLEHNDLCAKSGEGLPRPDVAISGRPPE